MFKKNLNLLSKRFLILGSLVGLLFLLFVSTSQAQTSFHNDQVTVKEYERTFTTYPYSDPDPIPQMSRIYPYFRYDGFTEKSVQKKWKIVELSNKYIRLLIMPQIGGKIWTAIEKSTGKEFIYFNHVVKFRDISERGPWTSGGIEPNYGIFGHTPDCFSPVDYRIRTNSDGSVSCIIGALDLLTRSTWRLEIKLSPNQAFFTTNSIWHNGSGMDEPYYSWMNAAVKAGDSLQFIYPGTNYIYHDGKSYDWPIDKDNGHNISWYSQNNFGGSKSYHVLGRFAEFYGVYWHNDNFGMAHCSPYGNKPGRKIWIWGLSPQGMIWKKLLTDTDGQYVEVQSGRLLNQAEPKSTFTPFKHKDFAPYATDKWKEYWMPVKGIDGFVSASPLGAMNVTQKDKHLVIGISPVRFFKGLLEVFDGSELLYSLEVNLKPMEPVKEIVQLSKVPTKLRVCIGGDKLVYNAGDGDVLNRPLESPANFNWNSTYGHYIKGKEFERQREYVDANIQFQLCLDKDSNFLPALVEMASFANRKADYSEASKYAWKALSIDTYDPDANYQFGIASAGLGHNADTKAAFSLAALSLGWRSAASIELAKEYLREKQYDKALTSAKESLNYDRFNLDALKLEACVDRLRGDSSGSTAAIKTLLKLDPLNHFAQFEKYLTGMAGYRDFTSMIRSNLAYETYIELACWYHNVGLDKDALKVLKLAPRQTEILYWQAYLNKNMNLLDTANAASPEFVFPFRKESIDVFEWADKHSNSWQPKYYLALIRWFHGQINKAKTLLATCGDKPKFAPFYAFRAQIIKSGAMQDFKQSAKLDPNQWRYGEMIAQHYLNDLNFAEAESVAADYAQKFPENNALTILYTQCLINIGKYQAAEYLLKSSHLLPAEGVRLSHVLFREAYLMSAVRFMKEGEFHKALNMIDTARTWPENLGVGQPYPKDVDDRLEDWLTFQCYLKLGQEEEAHLTLKILALQLWPKTGNINNSKQRFFSEEGRVGGLVHALALEEYGRTEESQKVLNNWMKLNLNSEVNQWAYKVLNGQSAVLPPTIQPPGCHILDAWLRLGKK